MVKKTKAKEPKETKKMDKKENGFENDTKIQENITEPEDQEINLKEEPEEKVTEEEQAEEKLKELQDKYIRLSAEFDNYRKRTLKEKLDLTKTAGEDILINLLPIMDDFERGIQSVNKTNDLEAIKLGMNLIFNKFKEFLKQRGIKEIDVVEKEFDTDLHEAVTKIPAPSESLKGKVVDVVEKGYMLHDKVIRYAKVVIGE